MGLGRSAGRLPRSGRHPLLREQDAQRGQAQTSSPASQPVVTGDQHVGVRGVLEVHVVVKVTAVVAPAALAEELAQSGGDVAPGMPEAYEVAGAGPLAL